MLNESNPGRQMNRIDRLTAILLQPRTKRILPGKEIADRFGICLRTVYRDIRALEDAGPPNLAGSNQMPVDNP
jgi:predicted DNA-binding transcriptional regulator YafY